MIIGLDNAGKSTLLSLLKNGKLVQHPPTPRPGMHFLNFLVKYTKLTIDFTSILYMHIVKLEFLLYFNFFREKSCYASDDPILTGKKDKMNSMRTL